MPVSVLGAVSRRQGLMRAARHLDAAGAGVRDTQEFHLHPGAAYRCRHAKGRQGAQGLGLGYWQKEAQGGEVTLVYILGMDGSTICTIGQICSPLI